MLIQWCMFGTREWITDSTTGTIYFPVAFNAVFSCASNAWDGGDIITSQFTYTYFIYWIGERVPSTTIYDLGTAIFIGI